MTAYRCVHHRHTRSDTRALCGRMIDGTMSVTTGQDPGATCLKCITKRELAKGVHHAVGMTTACGVDGPKATRSPELTCKACLQNLATYEMLENIAHVKEHIPASDDWLDPAQELARVLRNRLHNTVYDTNAQILLDSIWPQETP